MSRAFAALAASAAVFTSQSKILCEPKRSFYEDEKDVVPVPGTIIPSTDSNVELMGPRLVVNGVTIRSTSGLEGVFRSVRETLFGAYTSTQEYLNEGKAKVYDIERNVTGTVSALHNKREDLLPNSIYVVIAGLSGNILARQRGILARTFLPLGLGLAAFKYFLPETFSNTMGFAWKVEQRTVPEIANGQVRAVEKAGDLVDQVGQKAKSGQQKVHAGVETLRRKISAVTGLNIDEEVSKK